MITNKLLALCISLMLTGLVFAETIELKAHHPERYVVVKGDTLWGISAKFLSNPWRWPDVWEFNPQIENPHLIYPGDVITLTYRDGKPVLTVERGGKRIKTTKLSPKIHTIKIGKAIPTIPVDTIKQFLSRPRIFSERERAASPYIISSRGQHLIAGVGDHIYVRGISASKETRYSIYRTGQAYRNPGARKKDILGYEAIYVGLAQVLNFGNPTTMLITESKREALIGDLLLPLIRQEADQFFIPHPPKKTINGHIIAIVDGVSRVGQYQTVVINLGESSDIERGHVVAIYHRGKVLRDVISSDPRDMVKLPDIRSGIAMVFRTFDQVSYALIMKAYRDIGLYDMIRNP